MTRLSVQILAFNEEENIVSCINSVTDLADEIVVIDTGSTDKTVALATSVGAVIVKTQWYDDFSEARNTGLSHTAADWVLVLDADERLSSPAEVFFSYINNPNVEAVSICIENILDESTLEKTYHSAVRLFRCRPEYQFEGRIHEDISRSILQNAGHKSISTSPIRIIHYGYTPLIVERKDKIQRNLRLLKAALSDDPNEPFYRYHLGITHSQLGNWQAAKDDMMKAVEMAPGNVSYRSTLVRDTLKVLLHLEELQTALKFVQKYLSDYPDYPDLHFWNGCILEQSGYLQRAWDAYQLVTQLDKDPHRYVIDDTASDFYAYYKMGHIACLMNRIRIAQESFLNSIKVNPDFEPAMVGYADMLSRLGMSDENILIQLQNICSNNAHETWRLAKILFDVGAYTVSLRQMNMTKPPSLGEYVPYYECCIYNEEYAKARSVIKMLLCQLESLSIDQEHLAIDLAICYWAEGVRIPIDAYELFASPCVSVIDSIENYLNCQSRPSSPVMDKEIDPLISTIINRFVHFGLLILSDKVSAIYPNAQDRLPETWYTHGYTLLSANRLLDFMKQRELKPHELRIVGDVLLEKGHYNQALALFEESTLRDSTYTPAHRGAAKCYLCLARDAVLQGLQKHPDHATLTHDAQKIESNLTLLSGLSTDVSWTPAQRRNMRAKSIHFSLHDCEK